MYYDDYLKFGYGGLVNKRRKLTKMLCKEVVDISNGKVFPTIKDASVEYNLDVSTLQRRLSGVFNNNTTLRYTNGL